MKGPPTAADAVGNRVLNHASTDQITFARLGLSKALRRPVIFRMDNTEPRSVEGPRLDAVHGGLRRLGAVFPRQTVARRLSADRDPSYRASAVRAYRMVRPETRSQRSTILRAGPRP